MSESEDQVWQALHALASCLCTAVEESDFDDVCLCGVIPGVGVALDYVAGSGCKNADGMAWVRLVNQYPTVNFPQALGAISEAPECGGYFLAATVEIGIIRSYPIRKDGKPPDAATYLALSEAQLGEATLMRQAIVCCFGGGTILGSYSPIGPQGAAFGGFWTATILVGE